MPSDQLIQELQSDLLQTRAQTQATGEALGVETPESINTTAIRQGKRQVGQAQLKELNIQFNKALETLSKESALRGSVMRERDRSNLQLRLNGAKDILLRKSMEFEKRLTGMKMDFEKKKRMRKLWGQAIKSAVSTSVAFGVAETGNPEAGVRPTDYQGDELQGPVLPEGVGRSRF